MEPRHLLFALLGDPHDIRDWSGITMRMREGLERRFDRVTIVSKLPTQRAPLDAAKRLIHGTRYPLWPTEASLRSYGAAMREAVAQAKPDAILSVSSPTLIRLGPVPCGTFMTTDAPWASYMEAYAEWDPMPLNGPAFIKAEAEAMRKVDGVVMPSDWACAEAVRQYGIPPEAAASVPYGANLATPPTAEEFEASLASRSSSRLDLLYLGKDWERKGGPLTVETALRLRERGVDARLHIVGAKPELPSGAEGACEVHGFLRKDDPEEAARLTRLLTQSHFLFVPTRAEGYGIVFAEAAAYGMPVVSRRIHSLPTIVRDGETGLLLDDGASADAYAARIETTFRDRTAYEAMAQAARRRYEDTLNWDAFAAATQSFMGELMARKKGEAKA